jgi:hypothetical protein
MGNHVLFSSFLKQFSIPFDAESGWIADEFNTLRRACQQKRALPGKNLPKSAPGFV